METVEKTKPDMRPEEADLYCEIYRNVKMASESILSLMPKVENGDLKSELTRQLAQYEEFALDVRRAMTGLGDVPKEESFLTKFSAKMGIAMNTMIDASVSHLSEMMIEGSTLGITDLIKRSRNYPLVSRAKNLADKVIAYEEDCVTRLKSFL